MYIGYIKFIGSTSISTLIFLKFFIFSTVSLSNFWGLIFVEYLIKIEGGGFKIESLIKKLNEIDLIVSCYSAKINNNKSKYNLIFE